MATALQKRKVPALEFTLKVPGEGEFSFDLTYDFNAAAALQEKTVCKRYPAGINLMELGAWRHIAEPIFLGALFWAGIIGRHPEYNNDEGLEIIRSYMSEHNSDAVMTACWDAYLLNVPPKKRDFMQDLKLKAEAEIKKNAEAASKALDPPSPAAADPQPESSTGSEPMPSPESTSELAKTNSAT
jgi:hypothetical protein